MSYCLEVYEEIFLEFLGVSFKSEAERCIDFVNAIFCGVANHRDLSLGLISSDGVYLSCTLWFDRYVEDSLALTKDSILEIFSDMYVLSDLDISFFVFEGKSEGR